MVLCLGTSIQRSETTRTFFNLAPIQEYRRLWSLLSDFVESSLHIISKCLHTKPCTMLLLIWMWTFFRTARGKKMPEAPAERRREEWTAKKRLRPRIGDKPQRDQHIERTWFNPKSSTSIIYTLTLINASSREFNRIHTSQWHPSTLTILRFHLCSFKQTLPIV